MRWSDFQRLRPKRILIASATDRLPSTAPGATVRTDSLAFAVLFLSRNAADIPSFLIRKPTCAFVHRGKGSLTATETPLKWGWTITVFATVAIREVGRNGRNGLRTILDPSRSAY